MALYSCNIKIVARSKGRQACAAAAYQAKDVVVDERQGLTFSYRGRAGEEVVEAEVLVPVDAPRMGRSDLWNAVERAERRRDAQTARIVRLAIPRELTLRQMKRLVRKFIKDQFLDRGLAVDYAIHDKFASDGGRQPHVHMIVTLRKLSAHGFSAHKDRTTLARPSDVERFRADWAAAVNMALRMAGVDQVVDHRSLERQRAAYEDILDTACVSEAEAIAIETACHSLHREPEPKAHPAEWRRARVDGGLPDAILRARQERTRVEAEAAELYRLLTERQRLLQAPAPKAKSHQKAKMQPAQFKAHKAEVWGGQVVYGDEEERDDYLSELIPTDNMNDSFIGAAGDFTSPRPG